MEILVVLALLSVMTGTVALSFGGAGRNNSITNEADLLVARLNRAADEVVLTATPMQFRWSDDGYQFKIAENTSDWKRHPIKILGDNHALPTGLRLQSQRNLNTMIVDEDLIPAPRQILSLRLTSDKGDVIDITFDGVNATVPEVKL